VPIPLLLVALLGFTNRMSSVTITAMAVPVRNSWRNQVAFSAIPALAIQFAITKILAARKITPINPNTTTFRIVRLIIFSFHNRQ